MFPLQTTKKSLLLVLLLFPSAFFNEIFSLAIKNPEQEEFDLSIFNRTLINEFEKQVDKLQPNEYARLLSRLGKVAFFVRLIRRFSRSPNVGQVDFEHFFPKPAVTFHRKLYAHCSTDITKCINFIFENLQSRASFLFPIKGQNIEDFVISEENFNRMLSNNLFQFDVSISYLFCYLAKNRFSALKRLPYCSYGMPNGGKQIWPSDRYKELIQRSELYVEVGDDIEPIDELTSGEPFQCANQSFCPNPCCGYGTDSETCTHPICQNASAKMYCTLPEDLNSDFMALIGNEWNISCKCDAPGKVFRFDVERCVDHDECTLDEEEHCSADQHKECVNTVGSFECRCQMGFVPDGNSCVPLEVHSFEYSGPAALEHKSQ